MKIRKEERKYEAVQACLINRNRCNEYHISTPTIDKILEKHNIAISTLRRYIREEGYKTSMVDHGDHEVLWIKSKDHGPWGRLVIDGRIVETL